ncbi:hypothetical protein REPUB_Repub03eG0147800 [Reevesia pubescens]
MAVAGTKRVHVGGLGESVSSHDLQKHGPSPSPTPSSFVGTGKHRYSIQRVETPAFPLHFCDCEEHSAHFNDVKQKESQRHEQINGAMNEEELKIMSLVMNKLFEMGNVSNTSRALPTKERDDFIAPVEGSLSNEEVEEDRDDEDYLIINVVSNANNRATMSGSREQKKISSERRNSQFDESGADFEGNEADEEDLILNVVSMVNIGMALSGSTKLTKKFKFSETKTSEDGLIVNEHEEEKDLLHPKKKRKQFSTEERNGNEVVSAVPAEKENFQT